MLASQDISSDDARQLFCASKTAAANGLLLPPKNTLSRGNLALDKMHGLPAGQSSPRLVIMAVLLTVRLSAKEIWEVWHRQAKTTA